MLRESTAMTAPTAAKATPPWALVQTVDWPVPEPAPTPPRYAG